MPTPTAAPARISSRCLIVLSLLLLAAHAPLILNNGLFLDDWLVIKASPDYVADLDFMWHGAGHPVFYLYYSFANLTGAPIPVLQVMALAAVLAGGIFLALAGVRAKLLCPIEAIGFR